MTVTTNEFGQQNMWAKEPRMYIDPQDALETNWERAEKANGRWAMMGIISGFLSYAITGNFFFGIFWPHYIRGKENSLIMPDPNQLYKDMQKLDDMYEELLWHPDDELQFTHDGQRIIILNKTLEEQNNV